MNSVNRIRSVCVVVLALVLPGCWWGWGGDWPPHGAGGASGSGGAAGTSGTGGGGGTSEVCAPDDEFLLVTREVSGDCGPIYDEVVTPSSEGWFNPAFDAPCVVEGCRITCDRTYDSGDGHYVAQELDLLLGSATFDNPMTIRDIGYGIDCESDYLIDVTRATAGSAARRIGGGRTIANPIAEAGL